MFKKTRPQILIIFIFVLIALIVSTLSFIFLKKDKTNNSNTIDTITPLPVTEITWSEAINLIQNCQIQSVFQKNNLEVTLTDKNRQVFKTIEPKKGDVFLQTNHLRSDCNDIITTVTE